MINYRTAYVNNIQSISPHAPEDQRNVKMSNWKSSVEKLVKGYDNEEEAYEYILTGEIGNKSSNKILPSKKDKGKLTYEK